MKIEIEIPENFELESYTVRPKTVWSPVAFRDSEVQKCLAKTHPFPTFPVTTLPVTCRYWGDLRRRPTLQRVEG